jgi:hypothetical protein
VKKMDYMYWVEMGKDFRLLEQGEQIEVGDQLLMQSDPTLEPYLWFDITQVMRDVNPIKKGGALVRRKRQPWLETVR